MGTTLQEQRAEDPEELENKTAIISAKIVSIRGSVSNIYIIIR